MEFFFLFLGWLYNLGVAGVVVVVVVVVVAVVVGGGGGPSSLWDDDEIEMNRRTLKMVMNSQPVFGLNGRHFVPFSFHFVAIIQLYNRCVIQLRLFTVGPSSSSFTISIPIAIDRQLSNQIQFLFIHFLTLIFQN